MKILVKNHKKTTEELTKKANVFYAAGQLTDKEYTEVMKLINEI